MKAPKVLLLLLALSSSAFAQDPSPKLKLAREVISAMQVDRMLDGMTAQMKQMATQFAPKSDATPEQKQKSEALQEKLMDLVISQTREIVSKIDQVYGKHPGNPSTGSDLGLGIWANGTADPTQEKNP